ncbi:Ectonucleoside triphosphate diphosphohydrolase 5 [Desmophyllum pertusum]|uniref:nucleoside diphosphate phosphatase n=1 Tax=Desmophyllum pertusum TaxID=174260 RepID=A0A9W9YJ68_9CNID|nr:Ectonucleoside triphosphate diphosphohydrolase 5 [Desmophyllum pertusum]
MSKASQVRPHKEKEMFCSPHRIYNIRGFRLVTLVFFFVFIFAVLFLTSFADVSISKLFYLSPAQSSRTRLYGIMFDAGSTGSRIHVFTFVRIRGGQLELANEYFDEVKPGLSAYANDPKKGVHSIEELLEKADDIIPKDQWKMTPLALKATAGLRLLPSNSSKQLLAEVRILFQDSPYLFPDPNNVGIMDGPDEGLFAWITVNFLLGGLKSDNSKQFGTLDLGGGSTQITLHPVDPKTLQEAPDGFSRHLNIANSQFTLYTHSYLGLGLMAARTSTLELGQVVKDTNGKDVKHSPCIHSSFRDTWTFGGHSINFGGLGSYGFNTCIEHTKRVISQLKVHKPAGISSIQMYAFSYYYDRAVEMALIDKEKGGTITVGDFAHGAKEACSKESTSLPYLCLDATYILALLKEGFGFTEDRILILQKKIDGVEVSWGLGATLDLFNKMT